MPGESASYSTVPRSTEPACVGARGDVINADRAESLMLD
jgi:hypothetical protein